MPTPCFDSFGYQVRRRSLKCFRPFRARSCVVLWAVVEAVGGSWDSGLREESEGSWCRGDDEGRNRGRRSIPVREALDIRPR